MRYAKPTRESFIPKGARKICHKHSDAVAYAYERDGVFYAILFYGKAVKPCWHFRFRSEILRAERVTAGFEARQQSCEAKAKWRAEAKAKEAAWKHGFEPGDIFVSSWGYDQTNITYYEVVATSAKSVTAREISCASSDEEGFMTARKVPAPGEYKSEPQRYIVRPSKDNAGPKDGYFRWSTFAIARYLEPEIIAGVKVYPAYSYSWYA